jgi:hypothetical protein
VAKEWQQSLLSSGMPLENAVASLLTGGAVTEYRYWRRNERGLDEAETVRAGTLKQVVFDADGRVVRHSVSTVWPEDQCPW